MVADWLGVSRTVVRTAIKQGVLRAVRLTANGTYRVTEEAIAAWLSGSEVGEKKRRRTNREGVRDAERHGLV